MRIGLISEHASPLAQLGRVDSGGQNVYVAQIARHLARMGHRVDVFTRRDSPGQKEVVRWRDGVRVVHVPAGPAAYLPKEELFPSMGEFTDFMERFCRRQKDPYHLFHANFWMSGWAATRLKRRLGVPFVITFHALGKVRRLHQGDKDRFPDVRFQIEEQIARECDRIIAECPQDREDLVRLYDADPASMEIVPCGFDPREMWPVDKTRARKALGLPAGEKIVLQLGRMVPRKGVDNVIRGVALLGRRFGIPARLVIVGGDADDPSGSTASEVRRLRELAEQEGIADRVLFAGKQSRRVLRHFYSAADAFVTTPHYEPFGITPVEAMACGTPVVGSAVGGIQFSVQDGKTGFLVPPKNPFALARKLDQLFRSPELAQKLGERARARANALFTWEKVACSLEQVYQRVVFSQHVQRAVFLDKDGTLVEDIPYNTDPRKIRLSPGAETCLRAAHRLGFRVFVVSNQSGVALGLFPEEKLRGVQRKLDGILGRVGVPLSGFYYCPHHREGRVPQYARPCSCRKPEPGLLFKAAKEHGLDLRQCWMIGDILDDVEAGRRAGCRTILLDTGHETEWRLGPARKPNYVAKDLAEAGRLLSAGVPGGTAA